MPRLVLDAPADLLTKLNERAAWDGQTAAEWALAALARAAGSALDYLFAFDGPPPEPFCRPSDALAYLTATVWTDGSGDLFSDAAGAPLGTAPGLRWVNVRAKGRRPEWEDMPECKFVIDSVANDSGGLPIINRLTFAPTVN